MGSAGYPAIPSVHASANADLRQPLVPTAACQDQYSYTAPPATRGQRAPSGYPSSGSMTSQAALELEKESLRLEFMKLEAEKAERQQRYEREDRERQERQALEREREAAPQRTMQSQAAGPHSAQPGMVVMTGPAHKQTVVVEESYCGPISWIIGIFLFPCICFCPVDKRMVFM